MSHTTLLQGILQGARHVFLTDQLSERLWPPFPSGNLVCHTTSPVLGRAITMIRRVLDESP
jgi:hypothetical protein